MFKKIKQCLGLRPKIDFAHLVKQGATIIDVRTKAEYSSGHIQGSKNLPLRSLGQNFEKIGDKNKPVITCCASGMRSASAKNILEKAGFNQVYNGGGWKNLQNKLS